MKLEILHLRSSKESPASLSKQSTISTEHKCCITLLHGYHLNFPPSSPNTFLAITSDSSELSVAFSYAFPTRATKSFTVLQSTLGKAEERRAIFAYQSQCNRLLHMTVLLSTHLADEMTTECWSDVKILDK